MPELRASEERTIKKVLKENASNLIWITGIVFSFIMFVVIPQQEAKTSIALIQKDISTINTNHLTHLQNFADEIKDLKTQEAKDEEEQTKLMTQIVGMNAVLEMHVKQDTK